MARMRSRSSAESIARVRACWRLIRRKRIPIQAVSPEETMTVMAARESARITRRSGEGVQVAIGKSPFLGCIGLRISGDGAD